MRKRIHIPAAALLGGLCLLSTPVWSAPQDFETPEYNNSTGLRSLNASEAYNLGFTGQGVVVGVLDTSFAPEEGEFAGKYPYGIFPSDNTETHGIHVSGIIAALKDEIGMHGTAFDASLLPVGVDPEFSNVVEGWGKMLEFPQVRIINNSWGANSFYLDASTVFDTNNYSPSHYETDSQFGADYLKNFLYGDARDMTAAALRLTNADKLLVWAAGNDGHLSPNGESALPVLVKTYGISADNPAPNSPEARDLALHWISVAAFDPNHVRQDADGAWAPDGPAFPAAFTNMGLYAPEYTLWAPGVAINSTVGPRQYVKWPGTSMAAPYVSGVAALTQSAFPYMGGKQLADVLLSTASKFDVSNTPGLFILLRKEDIDPSSSGFRLYYDESRYQSGISANTVTQEDYDALVSAVQVELGVDYDDASDIVDDLITNGGIEIEADDYLSLFGAGIVNAGKAVRGPGYFDANRLENSDKYTTGSGVDYALYPLDSKGYDSVWSNNIGEKPATDTVYTNELIGLPVGLRKQGEGLLYLTGANTYQGLTLVEGGGVSLGASGQADGTAQLAGDVLIGPGGSFSGNGYVGGSLQSHGLLSPGLDSGPSDLAIRGNVVSDGNLLIHLWPQAGRANRLLTGAAADISGTDIAIAVDGASPLPSGRYEIISSAALSGEPASPTVQALQGVTLLHEFNFDPEADSLYASYGGTAANPRAKALAEGFLAGLTLAERGADLAAGAGMNEAVSAARSAALAEPERGIGLAAFAALSAGYLRHNTGSHLDMKDFLLMTGISAGIKAAPGFLTLGAFFEHGNGAYSTHNAFANAEAVDGDGDNSYTGGGILSRLDFADAGPGHFHVEASGRAGGVRNQYDSSDLRDFMGRKAEYDSSSAYYGLHLGAGYTLNLSEIVSLDFYSQYLWTRQEGDSLTLSTGDPLEFADADSSRLRLGGRLAWAASDRLSAYAGVAFEHEFDGAARASARGYSIDAPDTGGNTGVGELGLILAPAPSLPLSFDLGIQGYAGQRQGVTGSLLINLEF
ncbi:MAG: S8 family serine peptidase [Desulfarculales bacterium]|jgi:autotransporter-associated beta strand protein|nr:S8 family serine peptidase [Desulfarculales bacterium]